MFDYQSPFGENSLFAQSKERDRLIHFLIENKITEFVYSNTTTIDGMPVTIRIHGKIDNGIFISHTETAPNDFASNSQELNYLKDSKRFLVYKISQSWNLCDKYIDSEFVTKPSDNLLMGQRNLNDEEYNQIYQEFIQCQSQMGKGNLETKFRNFVQKINQQLANPFYKNVDIAVNVQLKDKAGNVLNDTTVKTNTKKKVNDIKLQIFLYPDGTYEINHQFSENYLKEFEKKWIEEAKARGLEVDIPAMRKDIIGYLNSEEAEASFGKKFLREIRTWYDASVAGYIEGIQATQKVTMHIWDEGTINRGIWHSTNEDAKEYKQWPKYMHLTPILGGATDGVVDEIVGIPIACKSIYEIATDEEKQKAFAKIFTKDGFNNLLDGFKNQATGILNDPQRLQHFTGQTTISVATTFAGVGAFNKVGKLDELGELVETAVKNGDDFIDGAATLSKIDELKKFVNHSEVRSSIDDLIKEFGSDTFDSHLDELLDAARQFDKAEKRTKFLEMIKRFRLGRKFESNVTQRLEQELLSGSGAYVDDLAQKLGKTVSELEAMPRLTQLQLHLPKEELIKYAKQGTKIEDLKDTWVTLDNVFVEELKDGFDNVIGYKLLANETKLSDLSPLTSNQTAFQKMLQEGKVDFITRSTLEKGGGGILEQGAEVTMGKWLQTTGKGVEEAFDLTTKSLF